MEYNTKRNQLIIPEYGRNIQRMIEYTVKIKDREERNKAAKTIIAVMGYLNPQINNVAEYKHKLWDHLFIISDFKLDVDSPYPIPTRETVVVKPKQLKYPNTNIKHKYYGHVLESLVSKIADLDEGPRKEQITQTLANCMKVSYLTWNKDSVDDSTIFSHLENLTKGKIKLTDSVRLTETREILAMNEQRDKSAKQFKKKKRKRKK